jgi:hypothetical protein
MLLAQDKACACCRDSFALMNLKRKPHVDHDHETGKVRWIICHHCNLLLGNAKDDPSRLRSALEHLKRTNAAPSPPPAF